MKVNSLFWITALYIQNVCPIKTNMYDTGYCFHTRGNISSIIFVYLTRNRWIDIGQRVILITFITISIGICHIPVAVVEKLKTIFRFNCLMWKWMWSRSNLNSINIVTPQTIKMETIFVHEMKLNTIHQLTVAWIKNDQPIIPMYYMENIPF